MTKAGAPVCARRGEKAGKVAKAKPAPSATNVLSSSQSVVIGRHRCGGVRNGEAVSRLWRTDSFSAFGLCLGNDLALAGYARSQPHGGARVRYALVYRTVHSDVRLDSRHAEKRHRLLAIARGRVSSNNRALCADDMGRASLWDQAMKR